MPSSRRCVFGCVTKDLTVHSFPNPVKFAEQFKAWVHLCGERLKNVAVEDIYPRMKVCDRHFIESHRNRNNRLNALAIPTLHIPHLHPEPTTETCEVANITDMAITKPVLSLDQEMRPEPTTETCEVANITDMAITMPELSLDQEMRPEPTTETCEVANITDMAITMPELSLDQGLYAEQKTFFEDRQSSAKHCITSDGIDPSAAPCQSDAIFGVLKDHDYCTFGTEKSTTKETTTKRVQGSLTKTFNVAYYKTTQKKTKNLQREIFRLRKKCISFKSRLDAASKLSDTSAFQRVTADMSVPARLFTSMQYREAKKKPKGRRFTLEEKILSLSFYKRSPKAYTLLHKSFTLPSSKSLRNLLSRIKIGPGINTLIFKKISNTVTDMNEDDRLCIIMFDEMSITPQVQYDANVDEIKGLPTIGDQSKIADHALTFMVRGIRKSYKQPVAYYFTQRLNKLDLKQCIKDVIRQVNSTGLKVVATVCDQSTVNVGAIESLIKDTKEIYFKTGIQWRNNIFMVDKVKIIPLYDVPHLIKGIRNNLITKDIKYVDFEDENIEKILKWEYFQQLYEADKSQGELKYLLKLTEEHVNPEKINKMKVKTATQLFSHSVAVTARHLTSVGELDPACRQITPIVKLLDNLFDSLNCSTFGVVNGKIFRAGVKRNSPHHKLWQDSIKFLKNMKYIEIKRDGSKIEKVVPSITNFIITIGGVQAMWKLLHEKYGFDIMFCRNLNQDPVENFFGSVRSLGVRNVSPNTVGFEGAFKSLLLNNFCSSQSIKSNCEQDVCTFLQSVDFLINERNDSEKTEQSEEIILNEEIINQSTETIEGIGQKSYVCGWVLKKCSKIFKNCPNCKNKLFASEHIPAHGFIKEKEYFNKNWLCYPSLDAIKCFEEISNITTNYLQKNYASKNIKKNIKIFTDIFVSHDKTFDCDKHKNNLRNMFEDYVIKVTIYSWCRSINRILSGKITYDGDDPMKMYAQMYHNKHKHNKNKK